MGTDLVGSSCEQLHFKQSDPAVISKRPVACFYSKGIRYFLPAYCHFVGFLILVQPAFDMGFLFYFAFYQAQIIFMKGAVVKNF